MNELISMVDTCEELDDVSTAEFATESRIEPRRETRTVEERDTRVVRDGAGVTTETVTREREVTRVVGEKQVTTDAHVEVVLDDPSGISKVVAAVRRHGLDPEAAITTVDVDGDSRRAVYRIRPPEFQ